MTGPRTGAPRGLPGARRPAAVRPGPHLPAVAPGRRAAARLGVALAGLALLAGCQSAPRSVGGDRAAELASPQPVATGAAAPGAAVPTQAATLPAAADAVAPVRLRIDRLGLTATVAPVGVDAATGEFAVPPSVDVVGWYRFGPGLETTAGSVVVSGHVDDAQQGPGAFFRLRELRPDDRVSVTGSDGRERRYRVVAREEWPKTQVPLDRLFARDGQPRLTLITCGGPFDRSSRNYRDNVVVTAVPDGG